MISGIRGKLAYIDETRAEIDTGSVVYEIFIPATMFVTQPRLGNEIYLYTHLVVKEDEMSLYGFTTREELRLFRMLITVSGIGPKGALSILSYLTPEKLVLAILSKDTKTIAKSQGIGAKTAEKLVIELKDKVEGFATSSFDDSFGETQAVAQNSVKQDVIMALTELGYSGSDAYKAVSSLPDDLNESQMLKAALRAIG